MDKTLPQNKIKLIIGLAILSFFFLYLRIRMIGHPLMWDEAWNILSLRAFLGGETNSPFYWFYLFHPPLYMAIARFLQPFASGIAVRLEILSLVISYMTFLIVYLLSAKIGGWRFAWLSTFFLTFMPGSIGYDTWIKRDGLASLFGYTALFLLLRKNLFWCALALSLSLLSKESGIFFVIAAMIFTLLQDGKMTERLNRVFLISLVVLIASSWWYLFFSEMTTHGPEFFFSRSNYSMQWAQGYGYYIKKLVSDVGATSIPLFTIGLFFLIHKSFSAKQPRWGLPVVVFCCVYIPISLIFVLKAPWLSIPAFPAIAMITSAGILYILDVSKKNIVFRTLPHLFIGFAFLTGIFFSYSGYHELTYPNGWPGAISSKKIAEYLNENMGENDKLLISEFEYWNMPVCPIFIYYWNKVPVRIVSADEKAEDIIFSIKNEKVSWLVMVDSPVKDSKMRPLVESLAVSLEKYPKRVGWAYVWEVDDLWEETSGAPVHQSPVHQE